MSLRPITLKTDKSITPVSDDTRVLRSTEKGLVLDVTILNEDDSPYDLTGKNVSFSEIKESDRVVADDGSGEESGKFTMIDKTKGHFSYQMTHQCYTASGTCFFQIKNGDTIVDTTQDFYFEVKVDPTVKPINDSYVSSLIAMENHLFGATQKTQNTIDQLSKTASDTQSQAKAVLDKINSDFTDYSNKYNKLSTDWANELKTISDQATSDINAKYAQKLVDLQNDYDAWKTKTVADFNVAVDSINKSVEQNSTDVANVTKQVQDTVAQMNTLKQQFDKVDFSKFVTGDTIKNYYTKLEVDQKLLQAGKVKTVDNIQPDSNGNITTDHYTKDQANQKLATKLTFVKCDSPQAAYDASRKNADDGSMVIGIYDPDDGPTSAVIGDKTITISSLYESLQNLQTQVSGLSSLQSVVDGKANSADVYLKTDIDKTVDNLKTLISNAGKVKTVNGTQPDNTGNISIAIPDISSKADKTDVNNLSNRITALENKKPIKASSQDDAVAKSQSSNNEYYW